MAELQRQSSASNGEQQELELEVLISIYGEEGAFTALEPAADGARRWAVRVVAPAADGSGHVAALTLVAQLSAAYPTVVPLLNIEAVEGLSTDQEAELLARARERAAASLGTAMVFTLADEAKDWLIAHSELAPPTPQQSESGAPLQRQGSASERRWRNRQKYKEKQERKRQKKLKARRPGTIAIGDEVDVHHTKAGAWLPATLIDQPAEGVCSVRLYNGQHMEQVPADKVRPKRLASRFLPPSALSDAIAATTAQLQQGQQDGPRILLPSNRQWSQREVTASQAKGHGGSQFTAPQPEDRMTKAPAGAAPSTPRDSLEPFSLAELHETSMELARKAVGAGAKPATKEGGPRGYRFVDAENVIKPSLLRRFRAKLKATREHCATHGHTATAPLMVFHATPFHWNLDKIIESGFLLPGDQESSTGKFLPIAHGAAWGPGCYLTPDVSLTDCYGYSDKWGRRQCLYCLVAPGAVHLLDPVCEEYDYDHWKATTREALLRECHLHTRSNDAQTAQQMDVLRKRAMEYGVDADVLEAAERSEKQRMRRLNITETPAETAELVANLLLDHVAAETPAAAAAGAVGSGGATGGFLHGYATNRARRERMRRYGPKQFVDLRQGVDDAGVYPDGSHTRLSPDRRQIMCGSSEQILPVLLVTYEPLSCFVNRKDLLLWSDPQAYCDSTGEGYLNLPLLRFYPIDAHPDKNAKKQTGASRTGALSTAAAEQWWSVSLDSPCDMTRGTSTRVVFLLERSTTEASATTTARLKACTDIMRELQPTQTALVTFSSPGDGQGGSTTASFSRVTTPASLVALAESPFAESSPLGLVGGLCAGVELALRKQQTVVQDEQIAAAVAAKHAIRTPDVPNWSKSQPVEGFARNVVKACLEHAVELVVSGKKTQWVDYAAATETAPQHQNTQPSTNWGLKTSILQKTEAKLTAKLHAEQADSRDQLYVFVVLTAEGSRHSDQAQGSEALGLLRRYQGYVQGTGLRSIIRFMSVGSTITLPLVERLKESLQTVEHWEPRRAYAASDASSLPSLTAEMCTALSDVGLQKTQSIAVGNAEETLSCGFVTCLTCPPKLGLDVTTTPGQPRTILFQGSMPRTVVLDGQSYRVDRSDAVHPKKAKSHKTTTKDDEQLTAAELHRRQLTLAQSLVTSLKIAAASGRLVDDAVRRMRGLLNRIRQAMLEATTDTTVQDLKAMEPLARAQLVMERRRLLSDIESVANEIDDTVRVGRARADCADSWTADLEDVKFGAAALKRVEAISEDFATEFSVEAVVDDLLRRHQRTDATIEQTPLQAMDAAAAALGMLPSQLAAVRELPRPVDLLSAIGMDGIVIRVARLAVAAVQPWSVVVEEVYTKQDSSAIVFGALASGVPYSATDDLLDDNGGELEQVDAPATSRSANNSTYDVLVVAGEAQGAEPSQALQLIRSKLHQLYLSVIFTRTASVPLPAQRLALPMVAFVKIAEQLLRSKMAKKKHFRSDSARKQVMHGLRVLYTIRQLTRKIGWVDEIAAKLVDADCDPAAHMTEAPEDNIASVVQVLCAPICASDPSVMTALFETTADARAQLSRVALASLGEAVSRGCRILVKQQVANQQAGRAETSSGTVPAQPSEAYRPLLQAALGIQAKSCVQVTADEQPEPEPHTIVHSAEFDQDQGRRSSNKFFSANLTNCTPWAVIASFGWCQQVHEFICSKGISLDEALTTTELREDLCEVLLGAFDDRKAGISTNTFARQHLGTDGKFPMLVQIALYAQGLRYSNSKARREGGLLSLADPAAALRALAAEERQKIYEDRCAAKRARLAAIMAEAALNDRMARRRLEAREALETHGHGAPHLPRLFSQPEVDALNMERAPTDQLEVMPSGLLRHHCCFPKCPHYLQSFATERDRQLGTREGLFNHFKHWVTPDR